MKNKVLLLVFSLMFIIAGCTDNSMKVDIEELQDYFETTAIENKLQGRVLNISISNSEFIKKQQSGNEIQWEDLEAFASIGALITSTKLPSNKDIDSISICIEHNKKKECYSYSLEQLSKIVSYVDISRNFLKAWGNKKFDISKSYLSSDLSREFPTVEMLKKALSGIFLDEGIKDTKLIAFKIDGNIAGLYVNAYYYKGKAQTYIFNYLLSNRDRKIVGITVPAD
ncbi:MAG: hypothetical protein JNM21_12310 [Taibaiella sp.]|nr:hypothetical protein [Taibaiella sp.]